MMDCSGYVSEEKFQSLVNDFNNYRVEITKWVLDSSSNTISVKPGEEWQPAIDRLKSMGGGSLLVLPGVHNMDNQGTIHCFDGVKIIGGGGDSTRVYRTGDYGDTIKQESGFAHIEGLFFIHGSWNPSDECLDYKISNHTGHIKLVNTQSSLIQDCILWRMPYGIVCDGAINIRINRVWINGIWDKTSADLQEGIADLIFCGSTRHCQLAKISNCYFSGAAGYKRDTLYSDGSNSITFKNVANVGSQQNILACSIEDLNIQSCYFGRASYNLLTLNPSGLHGHIMDVRVISCFFDDCGDGSVGRQIFVNPNDINKYVLGLVISSCTFNGEYDTNNALVINSNPLDNKPSVVGLTFTSNNVFAHTASPILLFGVSNAVISSNTITGWNSVEAALISSSNTFYKVPVYVGPLCKSVLVTGNTMGSSVEGSDLGNYCYEQVYIDLNSLGSSAKNNNYSGIVGRFGVNRGVSAEENQYIDTLPNNYQMPDSLSVYIRHKSTSSTVGLPLNPVKGQTVLIKDGAGNLSNVNVLEIIPSLNSLIDGSRSFVLSSPYAFVRFRFNGISWNRVG